MLRRIYSFIAVYVVLYLGAIVADYLDFFDVSDKFLLTYMFMEQKSSLLYF